MIQVSALQESQTYLTPSRLQESLTAKGKIIVLCILSLLRRAHLKATQSHSNICSNHRFKVKAEYYKFMMDKQQFGIGGVSKLIEEIREDIADLKKLEKMLSNMSAERQSAIVTGYPILKSLTAAD